MEAFVFYGLAAVMVVSSLMVILKKSPVHSALFLILTFLCLAGIFLQLNAEFIAAIQVIVYAGAIMVLFLFVIMLLNLEREASAGNTGGVRKFWSLVLCLAIAVLFMSSATMSVFTGAKGVYPPEKVAAVGNSALIGKLLFTDFILPFEITSVLLLAAIIGAVVLAKRKL